MNRRSFLTQMLKAGVGFSILPAAATYARQWRFNRESGLELPYIIYFQRFMDGTYRQIKDQPLTPFHELSESEKALSECLSAGNQAQSLRERLADPFPFAIKTWKTYRE